MQDWQSVLSDGLARRERGAWAKEKLGYLKRFLTEMSARAARARRGLVVADFWAGPGVMGLRGTDEVLPDAPLQILSVLPNITHGLFAEAEAAQAGALYQRLNRLKPESGWTVWQAAPLAAAAELGRVVPRLEEEHHGLDCIAILEPQHRVLPWRAIAKLAAIGSAELVLAPAQSGWVRMARKDDPAAAAWLDETFGHGEWRADVTDEPSAAELLARLNRRYEAQLRELGFEQLDSHPSVYQQNAGDGDKLPLYALLLAARRAPTLEAWRLTVRGVAAAAG